MTNWLINLERTKIYNQVLNGQFNKPMYCGIRFYSDKLVLELKASNSKLTIRDCLIELAHQDATNM